MKHPLAAALTVFMMGVLAPQASGQSAEEWFLRGNDLSRQGQFEDAVEAYQKSLKSDPASTVATYNLGIAHKNLRQYEKAAQAFKKVAEMEPGNLDAQLSLGNAYNFLERWKDAIGPLNIVIHRRQNDAEAHGNLGWAYYNYDKGTPFKILVILNLSKAVKLFKEQNNPRAAEATEKILNEALKKFATQLKH